MGLRSGDGAALETVDERLADCATRWNLQIHDQLSGGYLLHGDFIDKNLTRRITGSNCP